MTTIKEESWTTRVREEIKLITVATGIFLDFVIASLGLSLGHRDKSKKKKKKVRKKVLRVSAR